jgi:hypothetical protein
MMNVARECGDVDAPFLMAAVQDGGEGITEDIIEVKLLYDPCSP